MAVSRRSVGHFHSVDLKYSLALMQVGVIQSSISVTDATYSGLLSKRDIGVLVNVSGAVSRMVPMAKRCWQVRRRRSGSTFRSLAAWVTVTGADCLEK